MHKYLIKTRSTLKILLYVSRSRYMFKQISLQILLERETKLLKHVSNCNRERFKFSLKNEGKRDRKSAGSLGMLGHGVCFGGTPRDYVLKKILKMRKIQTSSTPSTNEITCNLEVLAQTMVKTQVLLEKDNQKVCN